MNSTKGIKIIFIIILLFSAMPISYFNIVHADSVKEMKIIGKVKSGNNTLEMIEPHLDRWGDQSIVSFKIRLTNAGKVDSNLARYSIKMITAEGVGVPTKLLDEKVQTIVTPKSFTEVTYYAVFKGKTTISNMKFEITEWNIKFQNFKKKIGVIKVPVSYQEITPVHTQKLANINGIESALSSENVYWSTGSKKDTITLDFNIENQDTSAVTLPEYNYFLKTRAGLRYELKMKSEEQPVSLDSSEKEQFKLYSQVPKGIVDSELQLMITRKIKDSDKPMYVTEYIFEIPKPVNWKNIKSSTSLQKEIILNQNPIELDASEPLYVLKGNLRDTIAMKVKLLNTTNTSINLPDLGAFYSIGDKQYKADFKVQEDKTKIVPDETLTAEITADVPKNKKNYNLKIILAEVISNDEKAPVYSPIIVFHKEQELTTGLNGTSLTGTQYINKDGTSILVQAQTVNEQKEGKKQFINGSYFIKNVGELSYKLPTYTTTLAIIGAGDFKGNILNTEQIELSPQESKIIKFSIAVPSQIDINNAYIQLKEVGFNSKEELTIPVAQFALNNLLEIKINESNWFDLKTEQGDYQAKINGTYRLPMNDKDLLVTDIDIKSLNDDSLALPKLKATYRVNKQTKLEGRIINLSNLASMNEDVLSYQIISEVPYSSKIKKIDLYIQEQGDNDKDTGLQIDVSHLSNIAFYEKNQPYKIETVGNQSEVNLKQTIVYPGENDDLIEIQMIQVNQDKRSHNLTKLVAYLATSDDVFYPLEIKNSDTNSGYQTKTVLSAKAVLPKGVFDSNVKLILGQAVSDDSIITTNNAPSGYVKAAMFSTPDIVSTNNSMNNLRIGPYKLNITNITTNVTSGISVQHSVYADLTKAFDFNNSSNDYSLKIELSSNSNETIEQIYTLGAKSSDNTIPLGTSVKSFSSSSLLKYTKVKIYAIYGDYESLLTTMDF